MSKDEELHGKFIVGDRVCGKSGIGTVRFIDESGNVDVDWDHYQSVRRYDPKELSHATVYKQDMGSDLEYKPGMVIPFGGDKDVWGDNTIPSKDVAYDKEEFKRTKERIDKSKDTNPKDAIGITKLPFSTISGPAMGELGLAMMEGALKYGRHNYRAIGIRYSVYFDAALRHIWSWWEGEDIDPDSGLPHIVKAMACLMILRDATIQGKYNDDRPPKTPKLDFGKRTWVDDLNTCTKVLREKYPNPKKPYTEKKEGE